MLGICYNISRRGINMQISKGVSRRRSILIRGRSDCLGKRAQSLVRRIYNGGVHRKTSGEDDGVKEKVVKRKLWRK